MVWIVGYCAVSFLPPALSVSAVVIHSRQMFEGIHAKLVGPLGAVLARVKKRERMKSNELPDRCQAVNLTVE